MKLLNTLILHRNDRSCHERGICQRTGPQCHRACHVAAPARGEQTIGYEAAPASNVHHLHRCVVPGAMPLTDPDEVQDRPADPWVTMANVLSWGAIAGCLLALVYAVAYSLFNPDSWLHRLGDAVMYLGS